MQLFGHRLTSANVNRFLRCGKKSYNVYICSFLGNLPVKEFRKSVVYISRSCNQKLRVSFSIQCICLKTRRKAASYDDKNYEIRQVRVGWDRETLTNYWTQPAASLTRSSAIAEGSRDASSQLKSCQLPRNSAETTCTTSPEPSISCRSVVANWPVRQNRAVDSAWRSVR